MKIREALQLDGEMMADMDLPHKHVYISPFDYMRLMDEMGRNFYNQMLLGREYTQLHMDHSVEEYKYSKAFKWK